ncbi:MAG TPA: hypothetical protein V6D14_12130 [Coleofasciculaceae cyanobacterium]
MSKTPNLQTDYPTPLWQLWCIFFAYTALIALLVQLVLLPYIFSGWHAGHGLLLGGDWIWFHQMAVEMTQKIHTQGWSAWELRPKDQAPVGIAAAIYALTVPQPWVLIPLNAALHATAGILLLRIIQVFLPKWKLAIWCILPFLVYPSAMTWYTQIHKDGFFIAGNLLFLYGWITLAQLKTWSCRWWRLFLAILWMLLGSVLVWLVRPYGVQMMQAAGVVLAIGFTCIFAWRGIQAKLPWRKALIGMLVMWALLFLISPLTQGGIQPGVSRVVPRAVTKKAVPKKAVLKRAVPKKAVLKKAVPKKAVPKLVWHKSQWLPDFLESKLYGVAASRHGFIRGSPKAGSNIDVQTNFTRAWDIIAYVPRATQIAFLAPFPNQWFGQGTLGTNTMMRRLSALEMTGVYLALIFLPYTLWHWRQRLEVWVILVFCASLMIVYTLAIPNIGTIYRMRYGFIMTLVALGIAGALAAGKQFSLRQQVQQSKQSLE